MLELQKPTPVSEPVAGQLIPVYSNKRAGCGTEQYSSIWERWDRVFREIEFLSCPFLFLYFYCVTFYAVHNSTF